VVDFSIKTETYDTILIHGLQFSLLAQHRAAASQYLGNTEVLTGV
jgi:hypothetical protein